MNRIQLLRSQTKSSLPELKYGELAYLKNKELIVGNGGDGEDLVINDWKNIINKPVALLELASTSLITESQHFMRITNAQGCRWEIVYRDESNSNVRFDTIMSVLGSNETIKWTETSTGSIGDTSGISPMFTVVDRDIILSFEVTSGVWNVSVNPSPLSFNNSTVIVQLLEDAVSNGGYSFTPPSYAQVGFRIDLNATLITNPIPGTYSGVSFTNPISLNTYGNYIFNDCDFPLGFENISGGAGVSRTVELNHCRVSSSGLFFEDGGQKDWKVTWSYISSDREQAFSATGVLGITDYTSPTPCIVEDCIIELHNLGTPEIEVEAYISSGGNGLTFKRVRFITQGPKVDGITGQFAVIAHSGNNALFDTCEFLTENCADYTVFSDGTNVLFKDCKFAKGKLGYYDTLYPVDETYLRCVDITSGESIH